MIVNAIRIVIVFSERRPVVLSGQRRTALQCRIQLYRQTRTPIRLVSLARLVDCSPGQVIFEKGQQISEAVVVTAGDIEAVLGSNTVIAIRPGQLIGDVSAYSGFGQSGGRRGSRA